MCPQFPKMRAVQNFSENPFLWVPAFLMSSTQFTVHTIQCSCTLFCAADCTDQWSSGCRAATEQREDSAPSGNSARSVNHLFGKPWQAAGHQWPPMTPHDIIIHQHWILKFFWRIFPWNVTDITQWGRGSDVPNVKIRMMPKSWVSYKCQIVSMSGLLLFWDYWCKCEEEKVFLG